MNNTETHRFNHLYQRHERSLKLQGMSEGTRDSYARAVRRIKDHFDCCPDQLTIEQMEEYFSQLVDTHSWSTVKIDRNGLQFFWKHVLKQVSGVLKNDGALASENDGKTQGSATRINSMGFLRHGQEA